MVHERADGVRPRAGAQVAAAHRHERVGIGEHLGRGARGEPRRHRTAEDAGTLGAGEEEVPIHGPAGRADGDRVGQVGEGGRVEGDDRAALGRDADPPGAERLAAGALEGFNGTLDLASVADRDRKILDEAAGR